jgi:hypothetical protein
MPQLAITYFEQAEYNRSKEWPAKPRPKPHWIRQKTSERAGHRWLAKLWDYLQQQDLSNDGEKELARDFERYKLQWKVQRSPASAPEDIIRGWPYRAIIALGPEVIPLLLRELEKEPDDWFWALAILTGANPVPEDGKGKFAEMTKAWLAWGRENDYI